MNNEQNESFRSSEISKQDLSDFFEFRWKNYKQRPLYIQLLISITAAKFILKDAEQCSDEDKVLIENFYDAVKMDTDLNKRDNPLKLLNRGELIDMLRPFSIVDENGNFNEKYQRMIIKAEKVKFLKSPYKIYLDFDGTVTKFKFPNIGEENAYAKEVIQKLVDAGHNVILNTYRADIGEESLQEAKDHLMSLSEDFSFHHLKVKLNPKEWHWDRHDEEKTIFIDDQAERMPLRLDTIANTVDWFEVDRQLQAHGLY